ncbi:MAG: DUF1559 domain-containing protein [Pirellulaceae bacterium]|nr:DUF1559 domain-containing protein [Pirellulaceae bacterium]
MTHRAQETEEGRGSVRGIGETTMDGNFPTRHPARAMTLVELLVAMAVVGVLVAVLLPAVQGTREAARRLQCQHHLKQLALAMHEYHAAHDSFPYGVHAGWGHSWGAQLLPFLEQTPLAERIPWGEPGWWMGKDPNSRRLQELARTQIPCFRCPAQGHPVTDDVNQIADRYVTNYLACAGGDATHDNLGPGGMDRSNGMFRASLFTRMPMPPSRFRDVRDGTSQTLMMSESIYLVDGDAGCWICDRFYLYHPNADQGDGLDFSEALASTYYPLNTQRPEGHRECAYSSHHPQGANCAYADASTHFVTDTVDHSLWQALGSMAACESVGP